MRNNENLIKRTCDQSFYNQYSSSGLAHLLWFLNDNSYIMENFTLGKKERSVLTNVLCNVFGELREGKPNGKSTNELCLALHEVLGEK